MDEDGQLVLFNRRPSSDEGIPRVQEFLLKGLIVRVPFFPPSAREYPVIKYVKGLPEHRVEAFVEFVIKFVVGIGLENTQLLKAGQEKLPFRSPHLFS